MVKVKEIMKTNVIRITPRESMAEAAKIMTSNRVGSLIVVENGDKPIDIVTESDVTTVVAMGLNPSNVKISDLKKKKIKKRYDLITVKPNENVLDITKMMVKNGVKRVPVVENGKLVGLVADKEILLISPELIELMSERLKTKVSASPSPDETIAGLCEDCGGYSDDLKLYGNRWLCPECAAEEQ